jgi:hypothetical protein
MDLDPGRAPFIPDAATVPPDAIGRLGTANAAKGGGNG